MFLVHSGMVLKWWNVKQKLELPAEDNVMETWLLIKTIYINPLFTRSLPSLSLCVVCGVAMEWCYWWRVWMRFPLDDSQSYIPFMPTDFCNPHTYTRCPCGLEACFTFGPWTLSFARPMMFLTSICLISWWQTLVTEATHTLPQMVTHPLLSMMMMVVCEDDEQTSRRSTESKTLYTDDTAGSAYFLIRKPHHLLLFDLCGPILISFY